MDAGTFPWRDVLLTVALATAAIVLFLRRQRSASPVVNSISDEERRKRRERLAAIAEQRAAAASKKAWEAAENGGKDGVVDERKIAEAKNCRVAPTGQSKQGSANDCRAEEGPISASSNARSGERIFVKKSVGVQRENDNEGENDSECRAGENMVLSDVAAKEKESVADGIGDVEEKSVPDNRHDMVDNASTGASDGPQTSANEVLDDARDNCGHRERHAKAIAKIMAKKREMDETKPVEKPADPPLTVHLILTSSPGSSRLDLTIPATATAAELLDSVSKASGVPEGVMKLIFRGRMITRQSAGRVAKEFGIENGSALHVVGKPRHQRREADEEGNSEEESSDSEDEDGIDSEAEDESETVEFSSPRARAELVARIRGSSGEGYFHRAAQRGDLDALREASVSGHSDLLRVPDRNGWTPLHEAARAGHADVVQYLVQHAGLDPNEATNQGAGTSPLSLALEHHGPHHPVTILLRTYTNRADTASTNPWADGAESD